MQAVFFARQWSHYHRIIPHTMHDQHPIEHHSWENPAPQVDAEKSQEVGNDLKTHPFRTRLPYAFDLPAPTSIAYSIPSPNYQRRISSRGKRNDRSDVNTRSDQNQLSRSRPVKFV